MKKFENYISNLRVLEQADQEPLDNAFIISGIIDKFSIQFELGWKVLKKLLAYERSLLDLSFFDGELWLDMLNDRYSVPESPASAMGNTKGNTAFQKKGTSYGI